MRNLNINDNLINKIKQTTFKLTKVVIAVTLVTSVPIINPEIAEAKGGRAGRASTSHVKPKSTPKPNKSTPSRKTPSKPVNRGPYKQTETLNNYSITNSPWFYFWLFSSHQNNDENIQRLDEKDYYTIADMSYNETQSEFANHEYYDITFTNGIKTTVLLKEILEKLKSDDEFIYLVISNTDIAVPVRKEDIQSWVTTNANQYTKQKA